MLFRKSLLVALCGLLVLVSHSYAGNIPHKMNYQGQLADSLGNPLDTIVTMTFRIYHILLPVSA